MPVQEKAEIEAFKTSFDVRSNEHDKFPYKFQRSSIDPTINTQ
jgi:hypothetical protein